MRAGSGYYEVCLAVIETSTVYYLHQSLCTEVEVLSEEEEEEEVVEVVDKEEEVDFEGEENSRACSVAGLGLGLGWMGRLSFTFFLESEFFVF